MPILKPTHFALAALVAATASSQQPAPDQQPAWSMDGLVIMAGRIPRQVPEDQEGILRATGAQPDQLRIARIRTPDGYMFIVQGLGQPLCNALGNCSSWVLDKEYHVLLTTSAESFRLQPDGSPDHIDIVTYVPGSATSGDLMRWRFDGRAYRRIACASLVMVKTGTGKKQPMIPEIKPVACR